MRFSTLIVERIETRMLSYEEVRSSNFAAAVLVTVSGVPLEVGDAPLPDVFPDPRPVLWCTCVTEVCTCDGPIIWIGGAEVRKEVTTDRRHKTGAELHELSLDSGATVLVESIVPLKAALLSGPEFSARAGRR